MATRSSIVVLYVTLAVFALIGMYSRSLSLYGAPQLRRQFAPSRNSRARLKLVQVVFRHGSRAPLNLLYWPRTTWNVCPAAYDGFDLDIVDAAGAKDPPPLVDKNATQLPGGCRMGQLTTAGYNQAVQLGSWLRQRYTQEFSLLPPQYQQGSVFAWTTSFTRTINTLRGVLSGLYPQDAAARVTATAVSARSEHEIMYGINATCPRLGPLIEKARATMDNWEASDKGVRKQAAAVKKALGLRPQEPLVWSALYDTVAAMKAVGKTLKGLSPAVWSTIVARATDHEEAVIAPCNGEPSACRRTLQLSLGLLANQLLANLAKASKCHAPSHAHATAPTLRKPCNVPPLMLYSGHDSTIFPLMAMLGHPLEQWPPFTSNVVVELWEYTSLRHTASHYVRVLYNGENLQLRKSTALGSLIPYAEFVDKLKPYAATPKQHKEMCTPAAAGSSSGRQHGV